MIRFAVFLVVLSQVMGCTMMPDTGDFEFFGVESTFRRMLARAMRGDAESQNAVGYMLFTGEGVPRDPVQAHLWFRRAANQGNPRAARNLAFMAVLGPAAHFPAPADAPSRAPAKDLPRSETHYLRFCSGCHGVNGIAAYENSPSFAFGERLEKGDAALMRSLLNGMQEMPGWEGKLSRQELHELLAFVRTLRSRYDAGIRVPLRAAPDYFYLFGPMEERRRAAYLERG